MTLIEYAFVQEAKDANIASEGRWRKIAIQDCDFHSHVESMNETRLQAVCFAKLEGHACKIAPFWNSVLPQM